MREGRRRERAPSGYEAPSSCCLCPEGTPAVSGRGGAREGRGFGPPGNSAHSTMEAGRHLAPLSPVPAAALRRLTRRRWAASPRLAASRGPQRQRWAGSQTAGLPAGTMRRPTAPGSSTSHVGPLPPPPARQKRSLRSASPVALLPRAEQRRETTVVRRKMANPGGKQRCECPWHPTEPDSCFYKKGGLYSLRLQSWEEDDSLSVRREASP